MRACGNAGWSNGPKSAGFCALRVEGKLGPHQTLAPAQGVPPSIPSGILMRPPFGHNRHGPKSGEAYFQSPKMLERPQPQTMSAIGSGHCGRKIVYAGSRDRSAKHLRSWTKYAFLRIIYSLLGDPL